MDAWRLTGNEPHEGGREDLNARIAKTEQRKIKKQRIPAGSSVGANAGNLYSANPM